MPANFTTSAHFGRLSRISLVTTAPSSPRGPPPCRGRERPQRRPPHQGFDRSDCGCKGGQARIGRALGRQGEARRRRREKVGGVELAQRAEQISGQWPLALLERLSDFAVAESPATASAQVSWQLTGQARPIKGGAAEIWLHMQAQISLPLCCQRALTA